jgi:ABC-type Na+ transport system ATPase subunit NatA
MEIYRRLTPRQRLTAATRLWQMARSLAARGVRSREAELNESEVARRVAAQFRDGAR